MRALRIVVAIITIVYGIIIVLLIISLITAGIIGALAGAGLIALVAAAVFGVALFLDAVRATPPACALVTRVAFRDTCEGACPPGQACTAVTTRPYGPAFLGLAPQAATCACVLAPGGAPGGGAPGGGGGGEGG